MKQIFDRTWAETDVGVRIFLLAGEKEALVIDTGMNGLDVRAMAAAHTDLPYRLLNTHADRDHIASNTQFGEFYMHPSEAAFYHNVQVSRDVIPQLIEGAERILAGGAKSLPSCFLREQLV